MTDISLKKAFKIADKGIISITGAGGKTTLMFRLAKELAFSGHKVLTTTTTKIFMPATNQSVHTLISDKIDHILDVTQVLWEKTSHFTAAKSNITAKNKLKGFTPAEVETLYQSGQFDFIIVEADGAAKKPLKASADHEPVVPDNTSHLIHVAGMDAIGNPLSEDIVHRAQIFSQNTGLKMDDPIDEKVLAKAMDNEIKKINHLKKTALRFALLNKADDQNREASGSTTAKLLLNNKCFFDRIIIASLENKNPIKKIYKNKGN
ncbi:MAG: putative selenium-dependent hydroxylase accessory protein YqeC [Desulfobacteraceae bacterium]|nr:putative selenium-dependent hydroxylase accessory protein YqeC [Desulfobacteraceae bacterium]